MNIPKQLVNLLGIVVVVGVLVAGVLLIALPMVSTAQQTEASTRTVEQTNSIYEVQVAQLREADARMDEITESVGILQSEIAMTPQLDDVYEIAIAAADDSGAIIESMTAADPAAWTIRVELDEDGAPVVPAEGEPDGAEEATETTDGSSTSDTAETTTASGTVTDEAVSPQQQVPITIAVTVTDAEQAAAFLDALGAGPRLILPTDSVLSAGTLTVNALAFLQTED